MALAHFHEVLLKAAREQPEASEARPLHAALGELEEQTHHAYAYRPATSNEVGELVSWLADQLYQAVPRRLPRILRNLESGKRSEIEWFCSF